VNDLTKKDGNNVVSNPNSSTVKHPTQVHHTHCMYVVTEKSNRINMLYIYQVDVHTT
jgi:hypothetical protein